MTSLRASRCICAALIALAATLLAGPMAFAQDRRLPSGEAALGGFLFIALLCGIGVYVFMALAVQTIAQKTATPNAWLARIPIANMILILNVSRKPIWWIVLFFIPLVNIIIAILVWVGVAEARQKPGWWGILTLIPIVNFVAIGYLAWAD